MGYVKGLVCKECKRAFPKEPIHVCEFCFGPLEVNYDYEAIKKVVTKKSIESGPPSMWRYEALLPLDEHPKVGFHTGFTPLVRAKNLGKALGLKNLYIKNDSVNPTFSFKDRPAGVAISKAKEFGLKSVGCASTGNLASATAAHAAKAGMPCYIFAPSDIETAKIAQALSYGAEYISVDGTYDEANRIAAQIGDRKGVGIVNINMRSYYVEGSKTLGYEVAEQLDWNTPNHLIVPTGSGAMLNAICKGFEELQTVSLLDDLSSMHMHCAQPHGCAPIVDAFKKNSDKVIPVEQPETVAKSLAIGDPGDGRYVLKRLKQYDGFAEETNDKEILDAILLLAKTEGIFTEPAGGVSVSVLKKMVEEGKIDKDETTVCYVTGNGLKATESIMSVLTKPQVMQADVAKISAVIG